MPIALLTLSVGQPTNRAVALPNGLEGLARKVWGVYHDDRIESDVLRYLYPSSEPIMGQADALFPSQAGIVVPADYFDRSLGTTLTPNPRETRKRLKMNSLRSDS
jgi:hypothetical protein